MCGMWFPINAPGQLRTDLAPTRLHAPPHWLHAVPPLTTKLRLLAVATATLRAACRFDRLPFDFAQGLSLSNGKARSLPRGDWR